MKEYSEIIALSMNLNLGEFVISEKNVGDTLIQNPLKFKNFRRNGYFAYSVINLINRKEVFLFVRKDLYCQDSGKYHKILYEEYSDALNKFKRDLKSEILTYEKMNQLKGEAKVFKKINRKQKLDTIFAKLDE